MEDFDTKPVVTVPKGLPPTELLTEDLIEGAGIEAEGGHTVFLHYVGVSWSSGREFDSSWKRDQLFDFTISGGGVIQGWDLGVRGMKAGGRRRLTIPPKLAYGNNAVGGVIAANDTLIFVVDLHRIRIPGT